MLVYFIADCAMHSIVHQRDIVEFDCIFDYKITCGGQPMDKPDTRQIWYQFSLGGIESVVKMGGKSGTRTPERESNVSDNRRYPFTVVVHHHPSR